MRVLCLYIDHFAVVVETRARPELQSRPLVVGGFPHERKPVYDCSSDAAALGIRPGLSLREAHHLCPEAVFLPLDEAKYARAFEHILAILDRLSPVVEIDTPGKAFMDATGLGKRFGSEEVLANQVLSEVSSETGFRPGIGLGSGKFVADVAAKLCSAGEFSIVAEGDEKDFLAPLPVELLPVSGGTGRMLKLLGLNTLGQISALAPDALASQFGQEGFLVHQLANGIDSRLILPRLRPAILEDELCAESPLDTTEALAGAVSLLLDRLLPELRARGQVCGKLRLRFDIDGSGTWQETLSLKMPTSSTHNILSRIRHRLEMLRFPRGITGVYLALADIASEPAIQARLLRRQGGKEEGPIEQVARELKSRLGKSTLRKVVALDPCSRIPERRVAFVDLPEGDD